MILACHGSLLFFCPFILEADEEGGERKFYAKKREREADIIIFSFDSNASAQFVSSASLFQFSLVFAYKLGSFDYFVVPGRGEDPLN